MRNGSSIGLGAEIDDRRERDMALFDIEIADGEVRKQGIS
jgi:hypothetical protein